MSVVNDLSGVQARLKVTGEPDLANYIVTIKRAIVEVEPGVDAEFLPLFEVYDRHGRAEIVSGDELRTLDGSRSLAEEDNPVFSLGSEPILDIHPKVNAICQQFFDNKTL